MLRSIGENGVKYKGCVIAQEAAWHDRYRMIGALVDQFLVTDVHPICALYGSITAVQAVFQNPGQVVAMDDTPDQGFLRVEVWVVPWHPSVLIHIAQLDVRMVGCNRQR
nr:hypothetical protein [Xanthomonas nasturtii]